MWRRNARTATSGDLAPVARSQQRSLLEASLDALAIIGPDAKIADANAALETVTGHSRGDLIGSDASRYFTDPEQARQLYRDALGDGSVRDRSLELRHRDGHLTSVLCSVSSYRDESGAVLGVVAAARPVSSFTAEAARMGVDPRVRRAASALLTLSSLLGFCLGASGLIGWTCGLPALQRLSPSAPPLAPLAASGFAAAAAACWLLRTRSTDSPKPRRTRLGRLLAAAVTTGGTISYAESALGSASSRALVDPTSALAFSFLGLALLGLDWTVSVRSRRYQPAHAATFTSGMISIAGVLDACLLLEPPLTSLGWPSALGFLGLTLAVVCARLDVGLGALLASPSLGGLLTRWLWPAAVVAPILLGMASRQAATAGLMPGDGGLTAMIISMIVLLGILVVWNGHRIDRSDRLRQSIQEALRRREQELQEAHRLARIGSWRRDLDDDRMTWSPELYRIMAREPAQNPPVLADLLDHQTDESSSCLRAALDAARSAGTPFETELTLLRTDDRPRFATARGEADRDADGRIVLLRGTIEDITERKLTELELARVHRAQQATSRCNQVLVRATDEATLLQQICDIIIEHTQYRSCWVGRAEDDEAKTVRLVARSGIDDGYLTGSTFTWASSDDDTDGVGECIRSGKTVLIADIRSDPRARTWRERALAHGFASILVIPLSVDARAFGALAIYASERAGFGPKERDLLSELADDLAFGLTTLQTRSAHARAEAQIRRLNSELEQRVQSRTAELRSANEMKDLLIVRQQTTSAELERAREREADVGFRIQQTLLLDSPPSDVPGLLVAADTRPSQRVDGDFYAFVNHQDQVLDVIVGDVMGKGILAALLGAATKTHFLKALGNLAGTCRPGSLPRPKDIVMMAHAGVARHLIDLESFVTLCYARIDMRERRLDFVDCGHTGIILRGQTGETRLLQGNNLPLGVREGEIYEQVSVQLMPGDTLLLFSDGITDARDDMGTSFGLERLEHCVKEHGALDPRELIAAVGAAVHAFSSQPRPRDDQTSVALHVETTRLPLVHSELEVRSDLKELGHAREFVRTFCRAVPGTPLNDDAIADLELATNEAVSNIMKHAYAGDPDQLIRIEGDAFHDRVSIRLRHVGSPFLPEAAPAPQFNGSRESGFGAFIIASSVDEVKYYRDAIGRHCVALFKRHSRRLATEEPQLWS
jgi:sigma-B regulation protein RsbU (phosphoserine phosphatase)